MIQRLSAALVGLGIILPAIIWGGPLAVRVVCLVALLVGLDEYARMLGGAHRRLSLAYLLVAGPAIYGCFVWAPAWGAIVLALSGLAALMVGLFGVPDTREGAFLSLRLGAGLVYLPLGISFLPRLRDLDHGVAWIFLVLSITWLGDTGAYFAGRAFGKTKLMERVSPKKTWEGFWGGLVAAIGGACTVKALGLPDLGWGHAIALGVILDLVGVVGDLAESMLKRAFDVKDSGWIMPGHGGILDRIDSVLFSAPLLVAYLEVFHIGHG